MDVEKFQQFIFEMDDVLEYFIRSIDFGEDLDFSLESLNAIEEYLC